MLSNRCFISYRRQTGAWMARSVFQDLRQHRIDAFLDVQSIDAGDFHAAIDVAIRTRPYFLPILSPAALERCHEPDDVLRKELELALSTERHVVPLVTTEFDRKEIARDLPAPLAAQLNAMNSVTLDHEYFEASMEKLRERFLKPVEVPALEADTRVPIDHATRAAAPGAPIPRELLIAQKHIERAFAAGAAAPAVAEKEFTAGYDIWRKTPGADAYLDDVRLALIELQGKMQAETRGFSAISNELKRRHDAALKAISAIR